MMVVSDSRAELAQARLSGSKIAVSLVLGVVTGVVVYYVIAVVATAQAPGNFTVNPLTLALIALVGALVVAIAWRWPVVGLTAGVVIVLVVAAVVAARIGSSGLGSDWLNPFNAVAFGAASGYPVLVGAVMASVSALRLRSRPA
ncbi:hypothetical protein [Agromyces ramosus]|uniref:F0F1-type ATP synthase assembly protein I n=1 Tax=Agromyces ramosus TaxID=33879 RepID=A0ABU0R7W5_9MICO|nr:hypothetical protein [Agromyces ramosus]MDQ0894143.1 F0F1-type ATP synthase assembly protein I [Agromyces ramosus]